MARAPKDYNASIRAREEKLAERARQVRDAKKRDAGRNDQQNARLLRKAAVHTWDPLVRMGAFLELEEMAKDARAVRRWREKGARFFSDPEPETAESAERGGAVELHAEAA